MELTDALLRTAIALGLGLIVGLQRERVQSPLAGIRTFALITLLGCLCGFLALEWDGWIVAVGALAVTGLLIVGNLTRPGSKQGDPGLTTEVAVLLMYADGAYLAVGAIELAVVLGGAVALLLQWKEPMHRFVARIGEKDVRAIMQFVLIALVIWPALPDEDFGPYLVLNPHNIWLMVVLIVGISLGGYVAYLVFGQQGGAVLAGILGGVISSTATTVTYARLTKESPASSPLGCLVLTIASTVTLVRVTGEVAVVAPGAFWSIAVPIIVFLSWMTAICIVLFFVIRGEATELPGQENPAQLKTALFFAALYAVVVLAVTAAKDYFGASGLYVVAGLSGLHDMDAITLSTAQLVNNDRLDATTGWRLIVVASMANLVMKAILAAALGPPRLLRWLAVPFGLSVAGGVVLLLLWR